MHCDDFSRTDAERRSRLEAPHQPPSAAAGRPGRDDLALRRRAPCRSRAPSRPPRPAPPAAPNAPVLVNVFVPGGLDLLDTLVPGDAYGRYADLRPALKVAQPLALGRHRLRRAPGAGGGAQRRSEGPLRPRPAGLHARHRLRQPRPLALQQSRHFWETGLISINPAPGWLGALARPPRRRRQPVPGAVDGRRPVAAAARQPQPGGRGRSRPTTPSRGCPGVWGEWQDRMMEHYARHRRAAPARRRAGRRLRRRAPEPAGGARARSPTSRTPRRAPTRSRAPVAYPGGETAGHQRLRREPALPGGLLTLPLGHPRGHRRRRRATSTPTTTRPRRSCATSPSSRRALSAFQADLEARGVADRVLTLVWTEFGRRPQENSSGGTDHGAGGIAWVMGTRARGGLLSPYPDLNAFDARRQPQGDHRLPRRVRRACSSSGWAPAPTRCCPTPAGWGASRSWHDGAHRRCRPRRRRPRHAGRPGHARVPLQPLPPERARRDRRLQHDELRRGRSQPAGERAAAAIAAP